MSDDLCKGNCESQPPEARALYVHVPFCLSKCRYCDFYSLPLSRELVQEYVRTVLQELQMRREELATPLESVFVGGGTPTALGPESLGALLKGLTGLTDAGTEFSVEANPGTISAEIAQVLRGAGVNRVNLGVQSMVDSELHTLGRIHSAAQAAQAIDTLRTAGLDNLGLDLIYGIPGQTLQTWRQSLAAALDMGVSHLSCYALSFEPTTPLWHDLANGLVSQMDESLQKDCYFTAIELAQAAGLEHYEISNFARPGRRCRHNITYWKNLPYLGLGPAAASFIAGRRRKNNPDLKGYLQALALGQAPPSESEHLIGRAAMGETIMLALRMIEGLDRREFERRFGVDVLAAFPRSISRYRDMGAIEVTDSAIHIARQFLFVADTILSDILAEA